MRSTNINTKSLIATFINKTALSGDPECNRAV